MDLFSGAGGWDVAARELGIVSEGFEIDPVAVATAEAAGLATGVDDVRDLTLKIGTIYQGLIASPPCQSYSAAGHGEGRRLIGEISDAVGPVMHGLPVPGDGGPWLTLEPARLIGEVHRSGADPFHWIAMEQVPAVLPIWEAYAEALRPLGYSVATGVLRAEQYGVPQTRRRAILIASLDREVTLPAPTHSRYHERDPQRMDEGVLPWVSMAEALTWGLQARPSYTVTGGGSPTGGAEPYGRAARDAMREAWHCGRFTMRSNYGTGGGPKRRATREDSQPSFTVTSKIDRTKLASPTIPTQFRLTPAEAAVLQTFPADYPWQGGRGQQYQQIGNAVPPLLAGHIIAAAAGLSMAASDLQVGGKAA